MISVIVPVYNVEKYLEKCVKSVQKQTYRALEIILVDDGSTDESGKICDELKKKDDRIKVIHQKNQGLSAARNTGLEQAKGEYVAFIDSDDYIEKEMYERMLFALENNSADICMCGYKMVNEQGHILMKEIFENKVYRGAEIIETFVLPLKTAAWNKLIKRESIMDNRFPHGRIHGEDLVFFSSYFTEKIKLVTVDYLGYSYVKHSNSITTRKFSKRSFDEVYCKDISSLEISHRYPQYEPKTICWGFRARINLIRKLIVQDNNLYNEVIEEYLKWLREKYGFIKNVLDKKTKIEYMLLIRFKILYKCVLRRRRG